MLASSRTPRRRKHTGWAVVAGRHVGQGHAPPANLAAAGTPAGWFGPLVKGGWLRRKPQTGGRLGDCLEAGSRSRKAAQGGTLRVGGRFRGRHFGAGQSLRPRLMARPPPFDKGGKLQGGACNQPGNHDPRVIANPCRGRFYIGPVCGGATAPGGYGIRPYNGFFNVAANRETAILALPRTCVGDDACIVPHPAAAQTHRVGRRFRGRHFGAGQSLRPRLAARPPPFDKGGKLRGGACNQPGNRDLDVIANPCRGRFYIGPVCDAANARGRIWNPPLQWFFQCCSQPGNHDPRVTANLCRGRCLHRPAPRGGANVPILKLPRCGGRERPPYRARETAATNRMESAPTWVFHGIRPPRAAGFL